jgi:hypothetical protein
MDNELDFFICKEMNLPVKPLDKFKLLTLYLKVHDDKKTRFRTHKYFGTTIQVVNDDGAIMHKYFWKEGHGFCVRNRNRKRTIPSHAISDKTDVGAMRELYWKIIRLLCDKKGPEWISNSTNGLPVKPI